MMEYKCKFSRINKSLIPIWIDNNEIPFKSEEGTNIFIPFSNFNGKNLCSLFTHEILVGLQKIEKIEFFDQINNTKSTFIKEIKEDRIKITSEKGSEKIVKEYKQIQTKYMKLIFPYDTKTLELRQYGLNFFIQDTLFKFFYKEDAQSIESNLSKSFIECLPHFKKDEKLRFSWYNYLPFGESYDLRLKENILEIYSFLK